MGRVAVVGAGIAGAACAAALRAAGVAVDVLDRGRAPGGRMAAPLLHGRRVDLGAAYFTVDDAQFGELVRDWAGRGLAHEWTDTLDVYDAGGHRTSTGPLRWGTRAGLRSLVRDLDPDLAPATEVTTLDDLEHDVVVLAMPDPQAARVVGAVTDWVEYEPVIAVAAGWQDRCWPIEHAAFVNDDPDITSIVDDGSRRGDHAPVLSCTAAQRGLDCISMIRTPRSGRCSMPCAALPGSAPHRTGRTHTAGPSRSQPAPTATRPSSSPMSPGGMLRCAATRGARVARRVSRPPGCPAIVWAPTLRRRWYEANRQL